MTLSVRRIGSVTVLDANGKLTLGEPVQAMEARFGELAVEGARILVNLAQVPYMDSAGIGGLIRCHKIATRVGAEIKLLNPEKRVFDLLHAVKLHHIFDVFSDESEAVGSFGSGQVES